MSLPEKSIPNELAMKVLASVTTTYLPSIFLMRYLSPLIYGSAATKAVIFQTEVTIVMPGMMIGIGLLALQARSISWMRLLVASMVLSIVLSAIGAFASGQVYLIP